MNILTGKTIVVTGGTGSLGKILIGRLMSGELGRPANVIVFSRDEAKQHTMRLEFEQKFVATDEIIYQTFDRVLQFRIGDVRDYASVVSAIRNADVVIHAAGMKQVPICEYFPLEAVRTNTYSAEHIVRAIEEFQLPVHTVVGVSTDKACNAVNVMGMTKALQERLLIQGNLRAPGTRFVCVRYGNVLASRGSAIPLFQDQIRRGGPVTITSTEMTRFVVSLNVAVDTIFAALRSAKPGETYIPRARSARMVDVATALIGERHIEQQVTGIRPGEKLHETIVSDEEAARTVEVGSFYVIRSILPELAGNAAGPFLSGPVTSNDSLMSVEELRELFWENDLLVQDTFLVEGDAPR